MNNDSFFVAWKGQFKMVLGLCCDISDQHCNNFLIGASRYGSCSLQFDAGSTFGSRETWAKKHSEIVRTVLVMEASQAGPQDFRTIACHFGMSCKADISEYDLVVKHTASQIMEAFYVCMFQFAAIATAQILYPSASGFLILLSCDFCIRTLL